MEKWGERMGRREGGNEEARGEDILRLGLVGLEGDLEDAVAKSVAVEVLNCQDRVVVVRHRHEAKS